MHLKENTETTDGRPDGQPYENAGCPQHFHQTKSERPLVTTVQITAINGVKQHRERPQAVLRQC